jgi:hypothetical protein
MMSWRILNRTGTTSASSWLAQYARPWTLWGERAQFLRKTSGVVRRRGMARHTRWLFLTAAATSAMLLMVVMPACGSGAATMPHIRTSVTVGQKPHEAAIHVSASGMGKAFAGIVLTYPDGHRELLGTATYSEADSGVWEPSGLPGGSYRYTIYATPAGPNDTGSFPVGKIVKDNAVASGNFVIP